MECGRKMPSKNRSVCTRPEGHDGPHCPYGRESCTGKHDGPVAGMCPGTIERQRERGAGRSAKQRATKTVCSSKGCNDIAPIGYTFCPKCNRDASRRQRADNPEAVKERYRQYSQTERGREVNRAKRARRRDLEAEANYTDLRNLDGDTCYICGQQSDKLDIEHVIPLSKWKAAVASDGVTESAWRTGCYDCNRGAGGKFETDHSAYLLRRFRAGKPLKPPRLDDQEPPHGALTPHAPGWRTGTLPSSRRRSTEAP